MQCLRKQAAALKSMFKSRIKYGPLFENLALSDVSTLLHKLTGNLKPLGTVLDHVHVGGTLLLNGIVIELCPGNENIGLCRRSAAHVK